MTHRLFAPINLVFIVSLFGLFLVVFGIVPREWIFLVAILILGYIILVPHEDGILFFARFLPFFFALPFTPTFDNFNLWRIAIIVLFLKWLFSRQRFHAFFAYCARTPLSLALFKELWRHARAEALGSSLFVFAFVSLFAADNLLWGIKRIVYFANMAILFIVVRSLVRHREAYLQKLAHNVLISGIVATAIGFGQWLSTYLLPPWMFHYWWGQIVSLGMYGSQWANIVTNFGNTWFSYSGGGLRLRMFSLFPDSHSFPLYLLLVLPFFFFVLYAIKKGTKQEKWFLWAMFVLMHLALILSGTRGIWAAIVFPMVLLVFFWATRCEARPLIKKLTLSLGAFIVMFPLAWAILFLPQFQEDNVQTRGGAFLVRIRSLVDTEETSNKGRIAIWGKTLGSIASRPLLGVGIGNYPTVLRENISASKAGASAHNLFLQIPAEMGVGAFIMFIWFLWEIAKRGMTLAFNTSVANETRIFAAAFIFSFVWVLGYSLTDAALFDERAFLGFMVLLGAVLAPSEATKKPPNGA